MSSASRPRMAFKYEVKNKRENPLWVLLFGWYLFVILNKSCQSALQFFLWAFNFFIAQT